MCFLKGFMSLRLAITVCSFVTALKRGVCFSSCGVGGWGFRLPPHSSTSRAILSVTPCPSVRGASLVGHRKRQHGLCLCKQHGPAKQVRFGFRVSLVGGFAWRRFVLCGVIALTGQ